MSFSLALAPEEFMPAVCLPAELPLIAEDELVSLCQHKGDK
jgi:hypothetical protein